jgi:phenylalanyl-tRNA synthetase beta chain
MAPLAVNRAAALLAELAGGEVASGLIDCYPKVISPLKVSFSPRRCRELAGVNYNEGVMVQVLEAAGVKLRPVESDEGPLYEATLPTFRPDLTREVDLFEEVVRLADFENLPATLPKPPAPSRKAPPVFRLKDSLREDLTAFGLTEHVSYSFINPALLTQLGLPPEHPWQKGLVEILNPLSEDHRVLRPSLIPGLAAAVRLNQFRGRRPAALFETGAVFESRGRDVQPYEPQKLGLAWSGQRGSGTWNDPARPADFWDLKGIFEELSAKYALALSFEPADPEAWPFYEPGRGAIMISGGRPSGHLGQLAASCHKALGLKSAGGPVWLGEIDLAGWPADPPKNFRTWSSYPGVYRDMALVVSRRVTAEAVRKVIAADPALPLREIMVFDLYQGPKIPPDQKSLALRLFFQLDDGTLTDELVNSYFDSITARLSGELSAVLRT